MQTIGERLEDARKKKGISIREAAEALKVRGDYLQRFEGNQFSIGLTDIYVRGFLRNYANYLKLPADRILSDFAELGHGDDHPRQPNREVYGRMDLTGTAAEDREEQALPPPEAPRAEKPRQQPHIPRSSAALGQPLIAQATIYKGGIIVLSVAVLLLLVWLVRSFSGGGSEPSRAAPASITAASGESMVAISATDNVRIKVARQSDGSELFQGALAAGERREFPNVPLRVTATALELIRIEYKGARYSVSKSGYGQAAFDFTGK